MMTIKRFILTASGDRYTLVNNSFVDDPDEVMFYDVDEELEYLLSIEPNRIWTWYNENGTAVLRAGYQEGEEGYYVSQTHWKSTDEYGSPFAEKG
jgi:hypothetical protein